MCRIRVGSDVRRPAVLSAGVWSVHDGGSVECEYRLREPDELESACVYEWESGEWSGSDGYLRSDVFGNLRQRWLRVISKLFQFLADQFRRYRSGEANYVAGTVVPAYVQSALNNNPVITESPLPPGAISATITYGQDQQNSALLSAVLALPEMFYSGFINLLLNDDPKGALESAASIARALGPGEVMDLLAGAQTAADGSVLVSRRGPELQPGNWVMRGEANWFNYTFSGKYQWWDNQVAPYSTGSSYWVPGSSLQVGGEGVLGFAKYGLGQSVYNPINIVP